MILVSLIQKREFGKAATAIPATSATQSKGKDATVARMATLAVANPTEAKTALITAKEEKAIRAWLAHIEETDPVIIAEVMDKCQREGEARAYFLQRSKEVREPDLYRVHHCGECVHSERIENLHLGRCAKGDPETMDSLLDTDLRHCEQYQAIIKGDA
jgi:hypothetical protein